MSKLPKFAALALIISILLIFCGVFLAINASYTDNKTIPERPSTSAEQLGIVILPADIPQQIKKFEGFTVSFNKENHTPNYVSWELLGSEIDDVTDRSNLFWRDEDIEGCPDYKDYTRSGYDRGHMCPAADQKYSEKAMTDCFVMANMCPQDHNLNAGAWLTLENKERQWAKRDSALIIIAGPIYTTGQKTKKIGTSGVKVPDAFFKVLLAPFLNKPRAIAFVYPNASSPGNMQDYALSVDELETITGYDFFSSLSDDIEGKVEANYSFKEWNRSR